MLHDKGLFGYLFVALLLLLGGVGSIVVIYAAVPADASPPPKASCVGLQWPNFHSGYVRDEQEIYNAGDYNDLRWAAKCYPYLRPAIARAAADGKVTQGENRAIEDLYWARQAAEGERERRAAAEELRRATR